MVLQEDVEPQQQEESGPYEEVYKDSSTFLKVELNTKLYDLHNNCMHSLTSYVDDRLWK